MADRRIGNQFWKLRSKHGRNRLFETPELLWEAACEYFQHIQENPLYSVDFKGKDAERVEIPHIEPFTIIGFCLYSDCNLNFLNQFEASLADKEDQLSKDFSCIITRIKDTIYSQKFAGAACGFYNSNIIARDLGLRDGSDVTSKGQQIQNPVVIAQSQESANEIAELLKRFQ